MPLAAAFCADICPNALDAVPPSGAAAGGNAGPAATPAGGTSNLHGGFVNPSTNPGNASAAAAARAGAGRWFRSEPADKPVQAETRYVWTLPPLAGR